jgi:hypothetical protein
MHADTVNVESSLANVDSHYLCCFHLCTLRFGHDARVDNKGGDGTIPLLDVGVLCRLPRLDQSQLDPALIGPGVHGFASELRPLIPITGSSARA